MIRIARSFRLSILSLSVMLSAVTAKAEPLTLEQALGHVYRNNPSIQAARYNLRATEELYAQARSGWLPRLSAEANLNSTRIESGNFTTGDGATTKGASVNLEQPIFRGFRTVAEMEAAQERIASDRAALAQQEQDIFTSVAEAYMNVIRDRLLLDLQRKNVALLNKEKERVAARFDAGDVTRTDVQQTEARHAKAVADDAIAQSRLQQSEAEFERLTSLWPPDEMVMPSGAFDFPETLDQMVRIAAAQNPSLEGKRRAHEAAESDIDAARSDFYPQVTAFASHLKEYDPQPGLVDESETSAIGVRARVSLYEGGNTISRIRQAKARANQRFVETVETEQGLRSEIIGNWRRLQAYEAEIRARTLEADAARYSSEGVREEARLGDRTVLDVLQADQEVLDAENALVEARRDRIVTSYRLAAALGLLSPDRLKLGEPLFPADVAAE